MTPCGSFALVVQHIPTEVCRRKYRLGAHFLWQPSIHSCIFVPYQSAHMHTLNISMQERSQSTRSGECCRHLCMWFTLCPKSNGPPWGFQRNLHNKLFTKESIAIAKSTKREKAGVASLGLLRQSAILRLQEPTFIELCSTLALQFDRWYRRICARFLYGWPDTRGGSSH